MRLIPGPWSRLATRRLLRRLAVSMAILLMAWLFLSSIVAYKLTHRRGNLSREVLPSLKWGRIEPVRLRTSDAFEVGAWFVEGRPEAASVLILHGHKASRGSSLARAELLAARGFAVMMPTLRAHGDSSGDYDDVGYGARHDVVAAVAFLERRRAGRPIVIDGNSMGAAAAVFAARELGHRVCGYILESPYQSLKIAVWNRVNEALPPGLSHLAYLGLRAVAPAFLPHLDAIAPVDAIVAIPGDVPVLILSGADDQLARPDEARALFDRVADHGRLVVFPGAGHGDLLREAPGLYARTVTAFCESASASLDDRPGIALPRSAGFW